VAAIAVVAVDSEVAEAVVEIEEVSVGEGEETGVVVVEEAVVEVAQ